MSRFATTSHYLPYLKHISPDQVNDLDVAGDKYFQSYLLNQINDLDQTEEVTNEYNINCTVLEIEDLEKTQR